MQIKVCLRCNFFLKLKKCHLTERKTSKAALMNFFSYRNGKIRMFHKVQLKKTKNRKLILKPEQHKNKGKYYKFVFVYLISPASSLPQLPTKQTQTVRLCYILTDK